MPVSMFKPIGGGTPLLVNLDNFPPTTITPGLPGKILILEKRMYISIVKQNQVVENARELAISRSQYVIYRSVVFFQARRLWP